MSCSARKVERPGLHPACEVYDGPAFQLVRKYVEEAAQDPDRERIAHDLLPGVARPAMAAAGLLVMVVSAKYGPIPWTRGIETYDEKMTAARAERERARGVWSGLLARIVTTADVRDAFVYGGADYKLAVPVTSWQTPRCAVELSNGGQGFQLQQLKRWLTKGGL